ncbi:Fe2+ or Zn2+ uptake regulation protein [Variovorax sp. OK605]|uniref:Fur family transcriptional regulator n=1 Tax=Variovorax sp. OK605 TaxID=1855317 RepID=UPI0008EE7A3D|nr:transcriptional repressor [Variovorax sp. OK605]SFP24036.1 Fe2+ or Zn2+ uptake regulation protein [Variovorax sp. OK605]
MNDGLEPNDVQRPAFMTQLRGARIRPSVVRLCVLQTLADAGTEWQRGEEVFRRMLLRGTSASLTTVYRVLKEFEHSGLIEREWVRSRGGALAVFRYAAPDAQADAATVRMRCSGCGASTEVHDRELHEALTRVALNQGLPPTGTFDVQIHGACAACRQAGAGMPSGGLSGEPSGEPSSESGSNGHAGMLPLAGFLARPRARAQRLAA